VVVAPTHDEAQRRVDGLDEVNRQRIEATGIVGDPGEVAEQAQPYMDAGLDGLTFSMPEVHDLEQLALAGETLSAVVGTRR
jgi:alkanesulfonate monooxygenase SsuD/methylene tetrahydromethanopterin reductase-like flavin-dependent oxidoreductase (luciferase family)